MPWFFPEYQHHHPRIIIKRWLRSFQVDTDVHRCSEWDCCTWDILTTMAWIGVGDLQKSLEYLESSKSSISCTSTTKIDKEWPSQPDQTRIDQSRYRYSKQSGERSERIRWPETIAKMQDKKSPIQSWFRCTIHPIGTRDGICLRWANSFQYKYSSQSNCWTWSDIDDENSNSKDRHYWREHTFWKWNAQSAKHQHWPCSQWDSICSPNPRRIKCQES